MDLRFRQHGFAGIPKVRAGQRPLARIFHKLAGFFTSGTVLEEKSGWTALVFRFRRNLILIVL